MIVIIAKHFNHVEQLVSIIDHSKRTHLSILNFMIYFSFSIRFKDRVEEFPEGHSHQAL